MLENIWNAITRLPMDRLGPGTQLGWSHPITSPTCPPWSGCHGNGRCLAMTHCTLSSCGRLETERVNKFWWNLASKRKLGPQWQSRDQILIFFKKFIMSYGRHFRKYSKCHNSLTNGPTETQLGWSQHIMSPTCPHDSVAMATAVA